jgi:hypothetical protein
MSFTKADVKAIIEQKGLDNLSAKSVRISLEERLGMEEGALKPAKTQISEMIDEVLNEMPQADGDEEEEEEEEEEEKPAKKAKKESKVRVGPIQSFACLQPPRSGIEAPF